MATNLAPPSVVRDIHLDHLELSKSRAQVERRAHFNKGDLVQLADSINSLGLAHPIVVRPHPSDDGKFEVIAGERRLLAVESLGWEEIRATVRELNDEQVLELQLIENLQREGLHELAEAEGYEQLLKMGHPAEEIAAKLSKSKGYVYARIKLLALIPEARTAFYAGNLSASTALLLARLPVTVQKPALKDVNVRGEDGPLPYREVARIIQNRYMLRLSEAPFDVKAEDLVRGALACGACPKNTLSQPELFGDVKADRAGVCTDLGCFKAKREAWGKLQISRAKETGQRVISGADAKKIIPYANDSYITGGYARLQDTCNDDPKHRTYKQILGSQARPALLQVPQSKDVIEVIEKAAALKKLKADGVIKPAKREKVGGGVNTDRDAERSLHERLFLAIHAKAPTKLSKESLQTLVEHELDAIGSLPEILEKAYGWDAGTYDTEKLSEAQLHTLLWELLILEEVGSGEFATVKLTNLAKSLKIDVAALKKQIAAEQKVSVANDPGSPAKASKKKAKK